MTNQSKIKQNEVEKRNKLKEEKPYVYEKMIKLGEKIRRGESIAIIQFQYNYACNFHCQHCLDGNSLVLTGEGFKKIKEVQFGEEVLSHKGNMRKVVNIFKHENSEPLIQIKPHNLSPINLTGNHKIFIRTANGVIKKEVKFVRKGDYLVIPKIKFKNLSKLDLSEILPKELNNFKIPFNKLNQQKYEYLLNNLSLNSKVLGKKLNLHPAYVRKIRGLIKKNNLSRNQFKKVKLKKTKTRVKYIYMQKSLPRFINDMSGFSKLLGYYAAEGCCIKRKRRPNSYCLKITFGKHEVDYINEVSNLFLSLFNIEPHLEEDNKCNTVRLIIHHSTLSLLFKELCGSKSPNKHVPNFVFQSNPSIIFDYLRGLFNGDGSIFIYQKNEYLKFTTVSEQLVKEVAFLLLQLGYKFSLQKRIKKDNYYQGRLIKGNHDVWTISIACNKVNDFLNKKLNPKYTSKFHNYILKNIKFTKNYIYVKVDKINKIEDIKKVYNLEVEEDHSYLCDSISVGNCSVKRFQGKKEGRQFTMEDVKDLARQADEMGLARFVITGGEPLVFKDLDGLVAAIDPKKFYINCDTNGWLFNEEKARHLKSIGVDRIQLSIDSLDAYEHDNFRNAKGSHERAMKAVDAAIDADLSIFVQTVVTKQRLHSDEFIKFIKYFNKKGVGVFVSYAKPVGSWEGNFDVLVNKKDMKYMEELEKKYKVFTHLTSAYGLDMGCIAVKGMISVTQYGDVLPCPYIHVSIGNVFKEPLEKIIKRGLNIKYFGKHVDTCLIAEDRNFIKKYVEGRIYGKSLPVPYNEVFDKEDLLMEDLDDKA